MNSLAVVGLTCVLALCLPQDPDRPTDPTVRDPRLERALEMPGPVSPAAEDMPAKPSSAGPVVELRGLVVAAPDATGGRGRVAAVLSIDGVFVRAEPNSTFAGVRVVAVDADGVRIEYTATGTSAHLR